MKAVINFEEANEMLKNTAFVNLAKQYRDLFTDNPEGVKEFLDNNPEFLQMSFNYAEKVVTEIVEDDTK